MHKIDWNHCLAAVWRARTGQLREIRRIDPVRLEQLLGVERQKAALCLNTERFLAGKPANNALLWGSRGTGKSSLIKALLQRYRDEGLRMIEVDKDDLVDLPEIVDSIREQPQHFIIFCDDLSFEEGENSYKPLKSALEGSLELPPENVLIYASSNRRHLLPERMQDNDQARVHNTEIHFGDAIEEKISLSDRFGLWLSFYPINQTEYLAIVDHYFADWQGDRSRLHADAIRFAQGRGVRSGRVARQFFNSCS
ncbi:ATP-binding protein [Marinobacterium aestuariivivens]|uniref:ATP-binding protein n=1 Tax=Marinobacterium aestuariivivens TaxID=1698799 RepID=A0ABW2A8B8_9GAMM